MHRKGQHTGPREFGVKDSLVTTRAKFVLTELPNDGLALRQAHGEAEK
jgi:hypothetical protein